jgi:hypothetical protein
MQELQLISKKTALFNIHFPKVPASPPIKVWRIVFINYN